MNDFFAWFKTFPKKSFLEGGIIVDVGAYQGLFTEQLIQLHKFDQAFLFEPHPKNFRLLKEKKFDISVQIFEAAVGNCSKNSCLYCSDDFATGSVLGYKNREETKIDLFEITQVKLDDFFSCNFTKKTKIGIIKIDTQGNDLGVLEGAEKTIEAHYPWLVIEWIFLPLYEEQSSPLDIWHWCQSHGYELTGIFDEHCSKDGKLAFADAVFIPRNNDKFEMPFIPKRTSYQDEEIKMLKGVADERLSLIEHIHSEAAKRLEIINELQTKILQ